MDDDVAACDVRAFKNWFANSDNRHAFLEISTLLSSFEDASLRLKEIEADATFSPSLEPDPAVASAHPASRQASGWTFARVAAVAAFAFGITIAGIAGYSAFRPDVITVAVYQTTVGERREIALDDGSTVTLNTNSRLTVSYTDNARKLRLLSGEAAFDVAHDETRPFQVVSGSILTTALGTSFDVRLIDDHSRITLYEGRVAVDKAAENNGGSAPLPYGAPDGPQLAPGERLSMDPSGVTIKIEAIDIARSSAWRSGKLDLFDTKLSDAIEEMNRHSQIQLRAANSAVGDMRISGVFRLGESEDFAETLELLLPIDAAPDAAAPNTTILLSSNS